MPNITRVVDEYIVLNSGFPPLYWLTYVLYQVSRS